MLMTLSRQGAEGSKWRKYSWATASRSRRFSRSTVASAGVVCDANFDLDEAQDVVVLPNQVDFAATRGERTLRATMVHPRLRRRNRRVLHRASRYAGAKRHCRPAASGLRFQSRMRTVAYIDDRRTLDFVSAGVPRPDTAGRMPARLRQGNAIRLHILDFKNRQRCDARHKGGIFPAQLSVFTVQFVKKKGPIPEGTGPRSVRDQNEKRATRRVGCR